MLLVVLEQRVRELEHLQHPRVCDPIEDDPMLPPRLDAVLDAEGNVVDAQAVPVPDLDEQMLRDWAGY